MSDLCPRWMLRDPLEIIERLLAESAAKARRSAKLDTLKPLKPKHPTRDRYYTMARRFHMKQLMKGRSCS